MLEWVLFLSQLGLWAMVIQLYRTRAQERQNLQLAAEPLTSIEFDFLDSEAVTRMGTIRTLLDEIEERTQRLTSPDLSNSTPSIPPIPSSAEQREELTAFLAPARKLPAEGSSVPLLPQRERLGEGTFSGTPSWGYKREVPSAAPHATAPPSPIQMEGNSPPIPPAAMGEGLDAAVDVRALAHNGLDASAIARSTGRQLEEVNLLLHLARRNDSDQGVRGAHGPLTEGRQA